MEEVVLDAAMPVDRDADAAEKEAFHDFLSDISPADFCRAGAGRYSRSIQQVDTAGRYKQMKDKG